MVRLHGWLFQNCLLRGFPEVSRGMVERITMDYLRASQCLGSYKYAVRYVLYEVMPSDWYPAPKMEYECVQGLFLLSDHYGLDYREEDRIKKSA
jgi:hypothetical protein